MVLNDRDAATVRAKIAPGQVWVLMNEVDHRSWPRVSAIVQLQRRALGLAFGKPGRRAGSRSPARARLIHEIEDAEQAGQPLKDDQIAKRALASGVWPDGVADDYENRRKRIDRLRRAAREG